MFISTGNRIYKNNVYGICLELEGYYKISHNGSTSYFNSSDGINFGATSKLENDDSLYIIDIEGKPYATSQDEKCPQVFYKTTSDFNYFIYQIFGTVKSMQKPGTYVNLPLKFDEIFRIYEYNDITGKFDMQTTLFGQIDNYFKFKFNYYERGATQHEDSLFNAITLGGVE